MPITVADPAIYLLSGALPVEAVIHKRILSLFGNITRLPSQSIEVRLAKRQLEIKTFRSHSWFIAVKKILIKYDLPFPETLIDNPPTKYKWKNQCNRVINKYWTEKVISQAKLYSSLKFLSRHYTVGKCHPAIKPFPLSKRDINRIPVKNKILTGSYTSRQIELSSTKMKSTLSASCAGAPTRLFNTFCWIVHSWKTLENLSSQI